MNSASNRFVCTPNEEAVSQYIKEILHLIDPQYPREEQRYLAACHQLRVETGGAGTFASESYIRAKESEFASSVLYMAWQGFWLNLRIFENPLNALMLREDPEDILQERRIHTIPNIRYAQKDILTSFQSIPEAQRGLTDAISDYFAYLQTTGYKLAHYIGFLFANKFLCKVIPGYVADGIHTFRYTGILKKIMELDLDQLEDLI